MRDCNLFMMELSCDWFLVVFSHHVYFAVLNLYSTFVLDTR